MGLLDDLKKKADALQSQQQTEEQLRQADIEDVDRALRQTFRYLDELLKQLAVIKPENASTFSLPALGDMKGLKFDESFINYRTRREGGREVFDYVSLYIKWAGDKNMSVVRDLPPAIEKLRIEAKNLLRFGADFFTLPARDVGEPVLEELARMLLGEASGFRRYR